MERGSAFTRARDSPASADKGGSLKNVILSIFFSRTSIYKDVKVALLGENLKRIDRIPAAQRWSREHHPGREHRPSGRTNERTRRALLITRSDFVPRRKLTGKKVPPPPPPAGAEGEMKPSACAHSVG